MIPMSWRPSDCKTSNPHEGSTKSRSRSSSGVMASWSRKDILKFIEIYKSHECLWRVRSKDYSNREMKDSAYDRLVQFMKRFDGQADRNEVVKKINNLRSAFRKEYKKMEGTKNLRAQEMYTPKLYYFEELLFLRDQDSHQSGSTGDQINGETSDTQQSDSLKLEEPDFFFSDLEMEATESNDQDESLALGLESSPSFSSHGHDATSEVEESFRLSAPPPLPIQHEASTARFSHKRKSPEDEDSVVQNATPLHIVSSHKTIRQGESSCSSAPAYDRVDKHSIFGQHVAIAISEMSTNQRIIAEKLISDVLFEGRFGNLSRNTRLDFQGSM